MPPEITFTPLTEADLPLLAGWLARPHVARWWGEPETGINEIRDGLGDPGFGPHLFLFDGRPAGYIQWWRPDGSWDIPVDAPAATTRGIDLFITDPSDCGQGLGPLVIRAFVADLARQGISRFLIDPAPENTAARRAYAKAGFVPTAEGVHAEQTYVLMVLDLPELAKASQ